MKVGYLNSYSLYRIFSPVRQIFPQFGEFSPYIYLMTGAFLIIRNPFIVSQMLLQLRCLLNISAVRGNYYYYYFLHVIRGKKRNYGVVLNYGVNGHAAPKYSKYGASQIALEDFHLFAAGRLGASREPWRVRKVFVQI